MCGGLERAWQLRINIRRCISPAYAWEDYGTIGPEFRDASFPAKIPRELKFYVIQLK
jgi:hypothetical protein